MSTDAERDMLAYYARRAAEYETIYDTPERQEELAWLRSAIPDALAGRDVVEVACGTGYWTAVVAPSARSVLATDATPEVLDLARRKAYPDARVEVRRMDAFAAHHLPRRFDGALAAFLWSHVPRLRLPELLASIHAPLSKGARVVLVDNSFAAGSSTPVAETDAGGDTWQHRRLSDGSRHRVLKNFPTDEEIRGVLAGCGVESPRLDRREFYWMATYELP